MCIHTLKNALFNGIYHKNQEAEKLKIYSVSNQKGGVGKSTTANATGALLNKRGFKVLCIDLDAQGNLSHSMKANDSKISSLDILTGNATANEAIVHTPQGDVIPSAPALAGIETVLTETGREYRLKEALEPISGNYDYCIIDTPPALGILTVNALTASDRVLIATQADIYSLQGISQLSQTIQTVKKYCNSSLSVAGIVITRYNARTVLTKDMTEMTEYIAGQLKTKVYNSKIRECIAVKEAQAKQQDIFAYSPRSNASKDYENLINEIFGEK